MPRNPPVPRVRLRLRGRPHVPRVRLRLRGRPHVPRVRTRSVGQAMVPEVLTLEPPPGPETPRPRVALDMSPRAARLLSTPRPEHLREAERFLAEVPGGPPSHQEVFRSLRGATGAPPRIRMDAATRQRLEDRVRASVYAELKVTRFSPRSQVARAEALVPARVARALRDGTALELLGVRPARFD